MGDNPIEDRLPASNILRALQSPRFQEAINGGIIEAVNTRNLEKGIDYFTKRTVSSGLAVDMDFVLILELAKLIIKSYYEHIMKGKQNA